MTIFKMPQPRLICHLFQAKEKWKLRALENQKNLRKLQVKIRDLEISRDKWKDQAKQVEKHLPIAPQQGKTSKLPEAQLEQYEKTLKPPETQHENIDTEKNIVIKYSEAPKYHSYPTYMIYMSICQVIQAFSGFRGGARSLEIMKEIMGIEKSPSYSCIRLWTYRLGLYLLQRPIEYREDRIFIVDMTIELGQKKCLLILGVNESRFRDADFCLTHHDVEVLALEIFSHTKGEDIAMCLENLSARIGIPKQIVSDQGSDIKKGIRLFKAEHPSVIATPDVSHKIACFIKPILENDIIFQEFNAKCNKTKSEIQQTELNFLKPPIQRTKARYHHIAPRIEWAQKVLDYQKAGDFHLIDSRYCIDSNELKEMAPPSIFQQSLEPINGFIFNTIDEFDLAASALLGKDVYLQHQKKLQHLASKGRQRFDAKLGWVHDYANELNKYQQMIGVIEYSEHQIKHEGLHNESAQQLLKKFEGISLDEKAKTLEMQIVGYINEHHCDAKPDQARLASSDVIESVFGQFKYAGQTGCLQEFGKTVLMIPQLVTKITANLVLEAMSSIKTFHVDEWAKKTFGLSGLANRHSALSGISGDSESA